MSDGHIFKKNKNKRIKSQKERKKKMKKRTEESAIKREREEKSRERNFSLRSTEIGSWVFVGAKDKVDPHIARYAWVQKSWSFVKLQVVNNFPTWLFLV